MFPSLCGLALACTVSGQSAQVMGPPAAIRSPPRVVEVSQRVVTKPRQRSAVRNPPAYLYQDQDNGCEEYNCIGPPTAFRLPDEVPYSYYEQQYSRPRSITPPPDAG